MRIAVAALVPRGAARHLVWNIIGVALPAVVALATIPWLARRLDPDRFALLALLWSGVAWYAMLDLGIGRVLALRVTTALASDRQAEIGGLVWSAGWLSWFGAGPFAIGGALLAPWLAERMRFASPDAALEAVAVLRWLALALPIVIHGVMLRAAFEGGRHFGLVNLLRVPMMFATYLGPLVVEAAGLSVVEMAGVVVSIRMLYLVVQVAALDRLAPHARRPRSFSFPSMRDLLGTGSWIIVSAIVSPLLLQGDRLLLPLFVPVADFGWYATVAEGAMRLWMLTGAMQPVLFAALVASVAQDGVAASHLIRKAVRVTVGLLLPPAVLLSLFATPGLRWWLGPLFEPASVRAVCLVLVGVIAGGFSQVAYAVLQSDREARAVGVLHLVQLPVTAVLLVVGAAGWGAVGVAGAWTMRLIADASMMWWVVARGGPDRRLVSHEVARWGGLSLVSLGAAQLLAGLGPW